MRYVLTIVLLALTLTCDASAQLKKAPAKSQPRVFRAGAATSNITPFLGDKIVGGFSPFPSTHVHDDLHARALVLDDGETKIVFVVSDNVSIAREVYDWARKKLEADTGIPASNMLMSATHTHSGVSARPDNVLAPPPELHEYQMFVARRIVDGVKRAINNLEPAEIAWGFAEEPTELHNRRWFMKEGSPSLVNPFDKIDKVKMNPPRASADLIKPAGPIDPQISFISVRAKDGRPISLLANWSLHYVGGVGSGAISADYFGIFADRIQQLIGADRINPPFVGMMSNGTSGDVNNINFTAPTAERRKPYEKMRQVADLAARKVYEQYQTLKHRDDVKLKAAMTELTLKVRKPDPETLAWARAELEKREDPKRRMSRIYAIRTVQQHESPSTINVVLQALRIGDLGIAALPFETFTQTGLDLKAQSPIKPMFTIELANGGYGYLPTSEQHRFGGYETWMSTCKVQTDAAELIRDRLLQMLGTLK